MTPWRRGLVALAVIGALLGGVIALVTERGPERATAIPEAGSGFRGADAGPRREAPVEPRNARERDQERKADAKLPVPLRRAAARLFLVGFSGTDASAAFFRRLQQREWGAVLIDRANVVDAAQLDALTGELAVVARNAGRRPPLVAAAQLGGLETTVPDVGPPRQALVRDAAQARSSALGAGRALRRRGIGVALAPAADLALSGGPWFGRGFSSDTRETAQRTAAAVSGWRAAGVQPVVGHFPGEGTASQDPELGVATVGLSRNELDARDWAPFRAIAKDAPAVQLSGALFADFDPVTPATLTPGVVQALRGTGFRGAVVSANLTAATLATGEGVGAAAVAALRAGCDLLFVPGDRNDQEQAYRAVVRAVRDGRVPVARVREALDRIERLR